MRHDVRLGQRIPVARRLEGDGPAEHAPVHFRQGDIHRQIARREPLRRGLPGLARAARQHRLQDDGPAFLQHRRHPLAAGRGDGEAGQIDHDIRGPLGKQRPQGLDRHRVLEAGDIDRQDVEPLPRHRLGQRLDGLGLAALHQRPVEHDRRQRPRRRLRYCLARSVRAQRRSGSRPRSVSLDARQFQPARLQKRLRLRRPVPVRQDRAQRLQKIFGIRRPALDEIAPQPVARLRRQRVVAVKPRVRLVVARHHDQMAAGRLGIGQQRVQPVGPVGRTAQNAHHHQLRVAKRPGDIGVDRHRMLQPQEVRQPQRRGSRAQPSGGTGQAGDLRIGRRQHDDVGRRLAEIDRLAAIVDRAFLGKEKMHEAAPYSAAACAAPSVRARMVARIVPQVAASSPSCRPMTTSRVARVSPGFQGRSK